MVHKEVAKYTPEFGDLEVEVVANKWYFKKEIKQDKWSVKIIFSKKEDKADLFFPDVEECLNSFKEKFDLICVIPNSDVGSYSPTLTSIASKLSKKYSIPYENVILRTIKPIKKMTECNTAIERCQVHKGTFALSRKLKPTEKIICLLDDIKAEGDTKLICAELLIKEGANTVKAICLGINTLDTSKNNEG
jgi:predicted amidophosphoribosyltransferase